MKLEATIRPGVSLTVAADVLAGYVLAAPALPGAKEALRSVPLLFASAFLLLSAGRVMSACFSGQVAQDRLKKSFYSGMAMAALGLIAAMAAAVSAGQLVVYPAAMLFLANWARTYGRADMPVIGPLGSGTARALCFALGASSHREVVYGAGPGLFTALGLYFAYGALVETLEQSQAEGGRRYSVTGAYAGLLAVFAVTALYLTAVSPLRAVALAGAGFLTVRALPAIRTLVPGTIRRFTEAAYVSALFLNAAIVWGRWRPEGTLLGMGAVLLITVPAAVLLFSREEALERSYT